MFPRCRTLFIRRSLTFIALSVTLSGVRRTIKSLLILSVRLFLRALLPPGARKKGRWRGRFMLLVWEPRRQ